MIVVMPIAASGWAPGYRKCLARLFADPAKRTLRRKAEIRMYVRAARFLRGATFLTALLAALRDEAGSAPLPPALDTYEAATLAAGGEPADDLTPPVADVRAHAILTAAPPYSRAPVPAGTSA
jgi:hypothetical protein